VVAADIVEVSPSYDGSGEVTALAAAQVGFEVLSSMVKKGMDTHGGAGAWKAKASNIRDEL
jgi:agmatinase